MPEHTSSVPRIVPVTPGQRPSKEIDINGTLSTRQVARLFGVDRRTVWVWARTGRLTADKDKTGKYQFCAAEVRQMLRKRITPRKAVN